MIELVDEAYTNGARKAKACKLLGISQRTLQRWCEGDVVKLDGRGLAKRKKEPHNKLTDTERQQVIDIANSPEFADLSPSQTVPALARGQSIGTPRQSKATDSQKACAITG